MFDIKEESGATARLYHEREALADAILSVPEAWVYQKADEYSAILSQYTWGEPLQVLQQRGEWLQVQSRVDAYSGWIGSQQVRFVEALPTHRTLAATALLSKPDLKSKVLSFLPQDAFLQVQALEKEHVFVDAGWVNQKHIEALDAGMKNNQAAEALLAIAETQLNRSYIWGGRGLAGLDCSAFVQYVYRRIGYHIPRDSDLQRLYLRKHHQEVSLEALQRGDLIFIPGHVMLAVNEREIIHASGHHMKVVREDLQEALQRYRAQTPELQVDAYRYQTKT